MDLETVTTNQPQGIYQLRLVFKRQMSPEEERDLSQLLLELMKRNLPQPKPNTCEPEQYAKLCA